MTWRPWKDVQVVVYVRGEVEPVRLEETVRLSQEAGFMDLLDALESVRPEIYEEVCACVARAAECTTWREPGDPALTTLDRLFVTGGPVICPGL